MSISDVKILDCTMRDGGYINNWEFSMGFATALYQAVSEAGVDYIETGFYRGESPGCKSPWANYNKAAYEKLTSAVKDRCKIAGIINFGGCRLDEIPDASETHFNMLRVVCHRVDAHEATDMAAALSNKGYETTVNYMGISSYTPEQLIELIKIINDYKQDVSYFYVADSFGCLMPADTRRIFDTLKYGTQAPLGFHPHNNLQMAFANSLEAISNGANIVDGSVFGMGRGAGNLFTEVMVAYLEAQGKGRYKLLPILQFADLFMEPLRDEYDWGISLPQMISGILKCHPNYPTNLLKLKRHTVDDIYNMLRNLPEEKRPRYNRQSMEECRNQLLNDKVSKKSVISDALSQSVLRHDSVMLLCGGASVEQYKDKINQLVKERDCYLITVNNPATPLDVDAIFFGNQRRFLQHHGDAVENQEIILGPTINEKAEESMGLASASRIMLSSCKKLGFPGVYPSTSGVMAILACLEAGFENIYVAGMDGFSPDLENYYYDEVDQVVSSEALEQLNEILSGELKLVRSHLPDNVSVKMVTPSHLVL